MSKLNNNLTKRQFIGAAGTTALGVAAASSLAAPYVKAQAPIRWRLQTYAGASLAEHVIQPAVDAFNRAAKGEMVIELYSADQLVPQGELFRAIQQGTLDAVQGDEDSMASPADVAVFSAYFPLATRYSLDIPVLWNNYGLNEIWKEAYDEIDGVEWLSMGAWDPCNFVTTKPIRSVEDLRGVRVFTPPTNGRFLQRFGVVPVTLPVEDIEIAIQTGELDGIAWCGATEVYTIGWAEITGYYLNNNISGAWAGSFFANQQRWRELPDHLRQLFLLCIDSSHYYRQYWYWWGEAHYRISGGKLELTSIGEEEWQRVEDEAQKYWDELGQTSPRCTRVVQIFKDYIETMRKAGAPYRYT